MHQTSPKTFTELVLTRPFCERAALLHDHICQGKSTMEHAIKYAGRQVAEGWAIVRLCEYAHSVGPYVMTGILDKGINEWIAFNHVAPEYLLSNYPRTDWQKRIGYLNTKYGIRYPEYSRS